MLLNYPSAFADAVVDTAGRWHASLAPCPGPSVRIVRMMRWPSYQFAIVLAFQLLLFNGGRADQEPSRPREKADTRDDLWFHFATVRNSPAP